MKEFTVDVALLKAAVDTVTAATCRSSVLPVLGHLLFEIAGDALRISGTDMNVSMTTKVQPVTGGSTAKFAVHAEHLCALLAAIARDTTSASQTIRFVQGDENGPVTLHWAKSRYVVRCLPAELFPAFEAGGKIVRQFSIAGSALRQATTPVIPAVGDNASLAWMAGVCCETIEGTAVRLVATDGHRLHLCESAVDAARAKDDAPPNFTLPERAMSLAVRAFADSATVDIALLDTNVVRFRTSDRELRSKVNAAPFMDYRGALAPEAVAAITVEREPLAGALHRLRLLADGTNAPTTRIQFQAGVLRLTAGSAAGDGCEDVSALDSSGADGTELTMQISYLAQAVEACPSEQVVLQPQGPLAAMVVRPPQGGGQYRALVMPVRT